MESKEFIDIRPLKNYFETGHTRSWEFRWKSLDTLETLVTENIEAICAALYADLRKPKQEVMISEIAVVLEEIRLTKKKLKKWMRPQKVGAPLALWPSRNRIYFEPLGTVLIIGPWNYPFQLTIAPLIGAIAAGNCAVIKPSELTPTTSRLIAELFKKYFSPDYVQVVEGGVSETTRLLEQKFDHIFFTGSTPVGRIVMQAAAKNLTPVTLELGGKSPAIVCEDADLDLAARRIVWGKFYNAGQTCVAPDYLYVQSSISQLFTQKIKECIVQQFGTTPQAGEDLSCIVNSKNCQRLAQLIDRQKVIHGGQVDLESLFIAPTVLENVSWQDPVMQEEIFGPLLPILTFENMDEALSSVRKGPKPLAAYLFSRSSQMQKKFIDSLSFGGGCINDVLLHLSNPYLPFGGVGGSGMGHYHGKSSFQTFSHAKSIMYRYSFLDMSARYAPYSASKLKFLWRIFRL